MTPLAATVEPAAVVPSPKTTTEPTPAVSTTATTKVPADADRIQAIFPRLLARFQPRLPQFLRICLRM